jgi:hypothetical protein
VNRDDALAAFGVILGATAAWGAFLPPAWSLDRIELDEGELYALRRSEAAASLLTIGAGVLAAQIAGAWLPLAIALVLVAMYVGVYESAASSPPGVPGEGVPA